MTILLDFNSNDARRLTDDLNTIELSEEEIVILNSLLRNIEYKSNLGHNEYVTEQNTVENREKFIKPLRTKGFTVRLNYHRGELKSMNISWNNKKISDIYNDVSELKIRLSDLRLNVRTLNSNMQKVWFTPGMPGMIEASNEFNEKASINEKVAINEKKN